MGVAFASSLPSGLRVTSCGLISRSAIQLGCETGCIGKGEYCTQVKKGAFRDTVASGMGVSQGRSLILETSWDGDWGRSRRGRGCTNG